LVSPKFTFPTGHPVSPPPILRLAPSRSLKYEPVGTPWRRAVKRSLPYPLITPFSFQTSPKAPYVLRVAASPHFSTTLAARIGPGLTPPNSPCSTPTAWDSSPFFPLISPLHLFGSRPPLNSALSPPRLRSPWFVRYFYSGVICPLARTQPAPPAANEPPAVVPPTLGDIKLANFFQTSFSERLPRPIVKVVPFLQSGDPLTVPLPPPNPPRRSELALSV